jgi:hypothetical protein
MFCLVLEFREKKWTFTKVEKVMLTFSYLGPRGLRSCWGGRGHCAGDQPRSHRPRTSRGWVGSQGPHIGNGAGSYILAAPSPSFSPRTAALPSIADAALRPLLAAGFADLQYVRGHINMEEH